jgi:hypothetical protein
MKLTLKIWRQKNAKAKGNFVTYKMDNVSPEMSFLEMLDALNKKLVEEDKDPVAFDLRVVRDVYKRASSRTCTCNHYMPPLYEIFQGR